MTALESPIVDDGEGVCVLEADSVGNIEDVRLLDCVEEYDREGVSED